MSATTTSRPTRSTQGRLLPARSYALDRPTREAGRRGLAKARAALAEAQERAASSRLAEHGVSPELADRYRAAA